MSYERPRYRRLPGGGIEWPLYCTDRLHLARVGEPTFLGVTRGATFPASDAVFLCDVCERAAEGSPPPGPARRYGRPVDVRTGDDHR